MLFLKMFSNPWYLYCKSVCSR